MATEGLSYTANGNIAPSRFIALVAGEDYKVEQCDASDVPVGISEKWLEKFDSSYHATAGKTCAAFGLGQTGLLELGGTVSAGYLLKPDADGKGVQASLTLSSHQDIGARALQSGQSGEFIEVRVELMSAKMGDSAT